MYLFFLIFRAVYFAVYAKSKKYLSKGYLGPDSKVTHICSGAAAGMSDREL